MVKWWLMILDNLQGTNAMHFMHLMHRTLVFQSVFTTRVVQGAGSQLVGSPQQQGWVLVVGDGAMK